ncbi:unnamed protein product [Rotaria magnacalcarata]|uniref:Uncharacterized protein n=2 Tax=Rotaria magnacalcarata TaxID=392030 RepID=A0A817AFH7_9BILA|nr:unnamed protein product [Rotaria magnacalcarata]CAF2263780.1 unnamed protein product [Rotaria magnacalcarata]CAF4091216.1 unnamed protein product [Rotaria magnacalcarata]
MLIIYERLAVSYLHWPVLEKWCLQELKQSRIFLLLTNPSSIMLDELEDISDDKIHFNQLEPTLILLDTKQLTGDFITHTNSPPKNRTTTHARRSVHDHRKRNKKEMLFIVFFVINTMFIAFYLIDLICQIKNRLTYRY